MWQGWVVEGQLYQAVRFCLEQSPQRVQAREPDAWGRLLDLYAPLVYSWCRRAGMGPEDSADVLQEVFRAVWSGSSGFRHDRLGMTPAAVRQAKSRVLRRLREEIGDVA